LVNVLSHEAILPCLGGAGREERWFSILRRLWTS
jgi:hypothetical protein